MCVRSDIGKVVGHTVGTRGIEVDPEKIKAITGMPAPKTEKEVRAFLGKIQYISRFIAKLTSVCEPIFKLLRKDQPMEWNERCQEAFDRIKEYLIKPPVLRPPRLGKPLVLYLAIEPEALGAMMVQADETGIEHAVYYLSKKILPYEARYQEVEKVCLAVIWASRKLQHYFQSYKIQIVAKENPLKYLQSTPSLVGKLGRWLVLLTEFDIEYLTSKVIKGRAVAEFLALQHVEGDQYKFEFPDEEIQAIAVQGWKMYFDGAVNYKGAGIGIVIVTPEGETLPMAKRLTFGVTNNMAEYEECVFGLETLIVLGARDVETYGDSMLVIQQMRGEWEVKEDRLRPYLLHLKRLARAIPNCKFQHLPREENQMADALATLAATWENPEKLVMRPLVLTTANTPSYEVERILEVEVNDGRPWYYDIQQYLEHGEFPKTAGRKDRIAIQK